MHSAIRYHDFSAGHRVAGHENKCRTLHGHNYRVHFEVGAHLDTLGRVLDFGVIKGILCQWLEDNWDHKMLIWLDDPQLDELLCSPLVKESIVTVPFNPTAENMAKYLCDISRDLLMGTGTHIVSVRVDETRKCSATYTPVYMG